MSVAKDTRTSAAKVRDIRAQVAKLNNKGMNWVEIGIALGITKECVYYHAKRLGLKPTDGIARRRGRAVQNQRTQKIYPSITQAAKAVFVSPATLCRAIKTNGRCGGDLWTYADQEAE